MYQVHKRPAEHFVPRRRAQFASLGRLRLRHVSGERRKHSAAAGTHLASIQPGGVIGFGLSPLERRF